MSDGTSQTTGDAYGAALARMSDEAAERDRFEGRGTFCSHTTSWRHWLGHLFRHEYPVEAQVTFWNERTPTEVPIGYRCAICKKVWNREWVQMRGSS